jgi:hypothetical protein
MQVALASVIQHMLAEKDIEKPKDIIAPQINPDDPNERVMMPTYYKDMAHLVHSPTGYVTTSMAGQLSKIYDLWQNKDFYGYEIVDRGGTKADKVEQSLLYVAPKPFSISSAIQMKEKGEPTGKQVMSFLGLNKAPGWMTHTDIENKIFDLYNIRNAGTKPYQEREANKAKSEIKELYKAGDAEGAQEKMSNALKDGLIRPSQVRSVIKAAGKSGNASEYFFSRLPYEDRTYLFDQMDEDEKKVYDPKGKLQHQMDQVRNAKEDK